MASHSATVDLPQQLFLEAQGTYPETRYMGSKQRLLDEIEKVISRLNCHTVLDGFTGSGCVGYRLKQMGKRVITNDFLQFCYFISKATVENSTVQLNQHDIDRYLTPRREQSIFVSDTFRGIFFDDTDNFTLDVLATNLQHEADPYKQALGYAALTRAVMKKQPRGIFTFVGTRYDDGRRDLRLSMAEQFAEAAVAFNNAVFSNGVKDHIALHGNIFELAPQGWDTVYLDPPYVSAMSDNDYTRRYHFVEGLVRYWKDLEINHASKVKKFNRLPSRFDSKNGIDDAFRDLFDKFKDSNIVLSYSSNSIPTMERLEELMAEHKKVDVVTLDHTYHFGNQSAGNSNNRVMEYLFVGTEKPVTVAVSGRTRRSDQAVPFLKWAGGKTQLLTTLRKHMPDSFNAYHEPFLGGGALFFSVGPEAGMLNDSNSESINCYRVVQTHVDELVKRLRQYEHEPITAELYYRVRALKPETLTPLERAARFIFLNRTCFNGLYRVNKRNEFNVPFGHYKSVTICDETKLRLAHDALQGMTLLNQDFSQVLDEHARPGDFVYIDPPYHPISEYSDFKRYTKEQFREDDQIRLAHTVRNLMERGCLVLVSNSYCDFTIDLYKEFAEIIQVDARRNINAKGNQRGAIPELLVKAYPR